MINEEGFSLIETIVALLIVSIVLISFSQFFIQSNKASVRNSEQLVVTYLADAELQRAKNSPETELFTYSTFKKPEKNHNSNYKPTITKVIEINEIPYQIEIFGNQTSEEYGMNIINVSVTVISNDQQTKSIVEGYIKYE